jgi:hypothetical protein
MNRWVLGGFVGWLFGGIIAVGITLTMNLSYTTAFILGLLLGFIGFFLGIRYTEE